MGNQRRYLEVSMRYAKLHPSCILVGLVLSGVILGTPASAQNPGGKPTREEIALKATGIRLDEARAVTATKDGKIARFTPAALEVKDENTLASGTAVGQLNTEFGTASLQPGVYDLFVAKIDGKWRAYAASQNGTEVVEAVSAEVDRRGGGSGRPEIKLGSITITLTWFGTKISYTWN
jgi:hypothetical protein